MPLAYAGQFSLFHSIEFGFQVSRIFASLTIQIRAAPVIALAILFYCHFQSALVMSGIGTTTAIQAIYEQGIAATVSPLQTAEYNPIQPVAGSYSAACDPIG